jgi:predicted SAM-dependent methyltransferase
MTKKEIQALIDKNSGIRLDIGCGGNKNPGFVGIDMLPLPGVDIVHDLEDTPWPLPDECVTTAVASHVLEHINPHKGVFIDVMNEVWRVLKPGGQFAFVVPYAESFGMMQDPTHCNFINEATMNYFDPLHPSNFYQFYRPKPWRIVSQPFSRTGVLECLLEKRPMDKSYLGDKNPNDITQEKFDVKTFRTS